MPSTWLASSQQMLCSSPSLQLDMKLRQQQQQPQQQQSEPQLVNSQHPQDEDDAMYMEPAFPDPQLQLLASSAIPAPPPSCSSRDSWCSTLSHATSVATSVGTPTFTIQQHPPQQLPAKNQLAQLHAHSQSLPMLEHLQQMQAQQQLMQAPSLYSLYTIPGNASQGEKVEAKVFGGAGSGASGGNFWRGLVGCFQPMWSAVGRSTGAISAPIAKQLPGQSEWRIDPADVTELDFLASGSQGSVSLGLHRGQQVALKSFNEQAQQRMLPDLWYLGRLCHPNVVKFVGCIAAGNPRLVMEYCPHGNLFEYYTQGTDCLPASRVADWARQLASGMAYLHENRIPHGDLKSPNILLGELDTLKITDFGLVNYDSSGSGPGSDHRQQQQEQQLYGTVRWMSPEQCRQETWSYPADVFSYGVILWEMLFQEVPYKSVDPWAVVLGVGRGNLSLPVPRHTPELMRTLMDSCWAADAKRRPAFRSICASLESGLLDLLVLSDGDLRILRKAWSAEIAQAMSCMRMEDRFKAKLEADLIRRRRDELHQASDIRLNYEKRLQRVDELQMGLTNMRLRLQLRDRAESERSARLRDAVRDRCCRRCRRALRGFVEGDGQEGASEACGSTATAAAKAWRARHRQLKAPQQQQRAALGVVLDRPIKAAVSLDCLAVRASTSASSPPMSPGRFPVTPHAQQRPLSPAQLSGGSGVGTGIGDRSEPFRRAVRRRPTSSAASAAAVTAAAAAAAAVTAAKAQQACQPPPQPLASECEPQLRQRPGRRNCAGSGSCGEESSSTSTSTSVASATGSRLRLSTDMLSQELQERLAVDQLSEREARLDSLAQAAALTDGSMNSELDDEIDKLRNLRIEAKQQQQQQQQQKHAPIRGPPLRLNSSFM